MIVKDHVVMNNNSKRAFDYVEENDPTAGFVEITLNHPDDFLKVRETLTRIGIEDGSDLHQVCHILHKKGRYFIVHYVEMHILDGAPIELSEQDEGVRNTVASLVDTWGLANLWDRDQVQSPKASMKDIKVIPFSEKKKWNLVAHHSIGGNKR